MANIKKTEWNTWISSLVVSENYFFIVTYKLPVSQLGLTNVCQAYMSSVEGGGGGV
jgi:hypothetical protein